MPKKPRNPNLEGDGIFDEWFKQKHGREYDPKKDLPILREWLDEYGRLDEWEDPQYSKPTPPSDRPRLLR
jgi:hypothetical protein